MDILVAHNFYQHPGGEDQCAAAETAMLKARGHNVTQYYLHNASIDAMRRLDIASRTIWSRPAYDGLRELFRVHRPQIAHFHNTFPLISPAAYYAARAGGVRVVQTVHNFRLLCANALLFRDNAVCEDCLGKPVPWPAVARKCYRGSRIASAAVASMLASHRALGTWSKAVDAYIAPTEFSRRKLIAGGLPAAKIVVKPNFVHPDSKPGEGTGGYGVFVGRLSHEKGLETLLEAWRRLGGELPLRIVGDGPLAAAVKEAAAKDAAIRWSGSEPLEAVYALIGGAAFIVVPSRCYETFGRVIIEAFAKGTPVIASKLGAMAEIVDNGRTGLLFDPGDPDSLVAAVRSILTDARRLAQMRQAARREFEENFTIEANYEALMAIYEDVLSGPAATASKAEHAAPSAAQRCEQGARHARN